MKPSEFAAKFIGQKELQNNTWTDDTELGRLLHAAGQKSGEAYCAYFAEAVFKKTCQPKQVKELDDLFNASAVQTFKNFEKAGYITGELPAVDWLVIWQLQKDGMPSWKGHAGIVSSVNANDKYLFESIEANTTDGTKENRDGGVVARKPHRVNKDVQNGLKVLGFVKIV